MSSRRWNTGGFEEQATLPNARRPEREASIVPPEARAEEEARASGPGATRNPLPDVTPLFESNTARGAAIGRTSSPPRSSAPPPRRSNPPSLAPGLSAQHVPLVIGILIVTALIGAAIPLVLDLWPELFGPGRPTVRTHDPLPWTSVVDYFFGK